jgi:hypothetical protein
MISMTAVMTLAAAPTAMVANLTVDAAFEAEQKVGQAHRSHLAPLRLERLWQTGLLKGFIRRVP